MKRVVHISNRVEIPTPGKATAGGLDEVIAHTPDDVESVRIGWSGELCDTIEQAKESVTKTIRGNTTYITFNLPTQLFHDFYSSVSNGFLWPLFHNRADIAKDGYNRNSIKGYEDANRFFAEVASEHIEDKDTIICHDYHLCKSGKYLRERGIAQPIGFFFHTPTPSSEILEDLSNYEQQQLVRGFMESLYHYDTVGCQSKRDLMNLKSLLGDNDDVSTLGLYETTVWKKSITSGVTTRFGAFPVAGNNELYRKQAEDWENHPDTLKFIRDIAPNGRVGALAVDRLDYTKGLVAKAFGVGNWLRNFAQKGETLDLLQIAPFGRETVNAYLLERARVETAFESLNVTFDDPAVLHVDKVPRPIILGAARQADIFLITPLRDGFNLVATETFMAKKPDNPASTILSKFTGAAGVLNGSCILVDPTRPDEIARAIQRAKKMSLSERQDMYGQGMEILKGHTSERWLRMMMDSINDAAVPRCG